LPLIIPLSSFPALGAKNPSTLPWPWLPEVRFPASTAQERTDRYRPEADIMLASEVRT
jgi:hypothetical protein